MKQSIPAVSAVLAMFLAQAVCADTIHLKKGSAIKDVQVSEENILETIYVLGESKLPQKYDSKKVARVEYESKPLEWEAAEEAKKQSSFLDALDKYSKCVEMTDEEYPWLRQYGMFMIGETYKAMGDSGDASKYASAIASYQSLLKAMPNTIHKYGCLLGIGESLLSMNKPDDATAVFQQVLADKYDPKYDIPAKIGLAKILEVGGKFREAKTKYREIYTEARPLAEADPGLKDILNMILVREGTCLVGMQKWDEAQTFFDDLIKTATDYTVIAGAYNGLGDCYYQKRKLEEAMWAYLRVVILCEHISSEAPKAFYFAQVCMRDLATKMSGQQQKDVQERAKKLQAELRRKFPGSPYASRR